ncbi:MAG TPA: sugar ABC transporter permease [Clostridiaceae bacterium]|nr:sugar ABC transporter permease [Clostridiaceae bacterium]
MEKVLGDKKAICIFVIPAFLVFFLMVILPVLFSLCTSMLKWDGIAKPLFIGFENYKNLLINNTDGFVKSIGNSFVLALLGIFVQLPLAIIFGLLLAKGIKGERFYLTAYFIPVVISTTVIAQLWMMIYNPNYGVLNTTLRALGLESLTREWLGSVKTVLIAVFIPNIWQYIGYHMLLIYSAAKSIPHELYESAIIDGSSWINTTFRITLPLILPTIKVCIIFAVIGAVKIFDIVYILTKGGPVHASEVPGTFMYKAIFEKNLYGYGSAVAIIIVCLCLLLTVTIQKIIKTDEISF